MQVASNGFPQVLYEIESTAGELFTVLAADAPSALRALEHFPFRVHAVAVRPRAEVRHD